jgi:biopolymer transport protein ExbD
MNYLLEFCLAAVTMTASAVPSVAAQPVNAAAANSSFAGTWQGKMNDLPGISLKIQQTDRKVSGAVVFYFQERSDPNAPWHVTAETDVPLVAPHVEGETLTFEVQHHVCHGCAELGPNVKFRMALAGPDEARLWNLAEETDSGAGLKLIRETKGESPTPQAMQKGISVELASTSSAVSVPDADSQKALIITVTDTGRLYFGINPVTADALAEQLKGRLSRRTQNLYIKADARAPYAYVVKVLDAAHMAGVSAVTLLTNQPKAMPAGTIMSPQGIEMEMARSSAATTK